MRQPRPLKVVTMVSAAWLCVGSVQEARADGGLIITEQSRIEEVPGGTQSSAALSGMVSSSGQRAVLWLGDDGCWDMFVDPGDIEVSGAAWVMPLPVVPSDIEEASSSFIDHLDAATLPLLVTEHTTIIEYYTYSTSGSSGGFGCGAMAGDSEVTRAEEYAGEETIDQGEEGLGIRPSVQVWQSGRLGSVAFEVVSSEDPASLETWLADNGYVNPEGLSSLLMEYTTEGQVFFTARLVRGDDEATRVPVFRFTLCGVDNPSYPVRLSALSVATHLGFTLWFVLPSAHRGYVPTNASLATFGDFYERTIDREWQDAPDFDEIYLERRESLHSSMGGNTLAVELSTDVTPSVVEQRIEVEGASADFPITMDQDSWSEELLLIALSGLRVVRLSGRLPLSGMNEDIQFVPGDISAEAGVYRREVIEREYVYDDDAEVDEGPEEEEVAPLFDDASSCRISSGQERSSRASPELPLLAFIAVAGVILWRRLKLF